MKVMEIVSRDPQFLSADLTWRFGACTGGVEFSAQMPPKSSSTSAEKIESRS
jgi:hypothetical protein